MISFDIVTQWWQTFFHSRLCVLEEVNHVHIFIFALQKIWMIYTYNIINCIYPIYG